MSEFEQLVAQHMGRCVHFNGLQHECCEAGVSYRSVRDVSQPGVPRWPCLPQIPSYGPPPVTTCERREFPTREQGKEGDGAE